MRRPTPAMLVALAALFIALGGAGMAATGGNFILGKQNSASDTSLLGSGVTGGPTLRVTNSGGRPAARFDANVNVAPLVVSNATKVQNLNADQLDGLDSAGFIQGNGRSGGNSLVVLPGHNQYAIATAPGLGTFSGFCSAGTPADGVIDFSNGSSGTLNVTIVSNRATSFSDTTTLADTFTLASGETMQGNYVTAGNPSASLTTWQLNAASGGMVATAVTSATVTGAGNCVFRASYVENG